MKNYILAIHLLCLCKSLISIGYAKKSFRILVWFHRNKKMFTILNIIPFRIIL